MHVFKQYNTFIYEQIHFEPFWVDLVTKNFDFSLSEIASLAYCRRKIQGAARGPTRSSSPIFDCLLFFQTQYNLF